LRRGSFFRVAELIQAIEEYLKETNRQPKPFRWTVSVEKITDKINRGSVISEIPR
jgi:hypothetical protein